MICFDTHLLIWGVRGFAEPTQTKMIGRARRYIRWLDEHKERVMVPAVALAEYLAGFERKDREKQRRVIERHFFIPAFDLACTEEVSNLREDPALIKAVKSESGVPRQCLKVDVMIIATAIRHGAEKIVTHEHKNFKKMARGLIEIEDLPDIQEQDLLPFAD